MLNPLFCYILIVCEYSLSHQKQDSRRPNTLTRLLCTFGLYNQSLTSKLSILNILICQCSPKSLEDVFICGEVAEWSKALVSKTSVPPGTQGSNPCLSAILFLTSLLPMLYNKFLASCSPFC